MIFLLKLLLKTILSTLRYLYIWEQTSKLFAHTLVHFIFLQIGCKNKRKIKQMAVSFLSLASCPRKKNGRNSYLDKHSSHPDYKHGKTGDYASLALLTWQPRTQVIIQNKKQSKHWKIYNGNPENRKITEHKYQPFQTIRAFCGNVQTFINFGISNIRHITACFQMDYHMSE